MRIGTWNLDARWSEGHASLLARHHCDVWLLTEVTPEALRSASDEIGFSYSCSRGVMSRGQHWAAVLSLTPPVPLPDPHTASAAVLIEDLTFCATVLPWAGCAKHSPSAWSGSSLAQMAKPALNQLMRELPRANVVWGGDWNQNLCGDWQNVGSREMRRDIEATLACLRLRSITAALPCAVGTGRYTIDHIAVPSDWQVHSAERIATAGLSDHDAYVVDVR